MGAKRLLYLAAVAALVGLGALGGAAQAQEPPTDPYGPTTTTAPPAAAEVRCEISPETAAPGQTVTATVTGAPEGTDVSLVLDGSEVARETVPPGDPTRVELSFVVPSLEPGSYSIAAVGANFTVRCGATGELTVLAATDAAEAPAPGAPSPGIGALPRTGITIALLLAAGAVLVLAGRALLSESRRRRRARARSADVAQAPRHRVRA